MNFSYNYIIKPWFSIEYFKINKLQKYCTHTIPVIKTNMPPKSTVLSIIKTEECQYANITTCILENSKEPNSKEPNSKEPNSKEAITKEPQLIINYSNKPLVYNNQPKLVLAHKMYGYPYLDISGEYGISNRDNYVIIREKLEDLSRLQIFLSTKTVRYIFKATRYRMAYLEKYAFELIPDITFLPDFPQEINDDTIADYFGFDEKDRANINKIR